MTRLRPFAFALSLLLLSTTGGGVTFAHDNDRNGNNYGSYQQRGYSDRGPDRGHDRYDRHDGNGRNDRNDRDYRYNYWNVSLSQRERDEVGRRFYEAYNRQCGGNVAWQSYYDCDRYQPYQIGRRLEPNVITYNLPGSVTTRLPKPHPDTRYVWVNRDILLVSKWDGTVLDRVISLR